jgi:hypothetical protein
MKKKIIVQTGIILSTSLILGSSILPVTTMAMEIKNTKQEVNNQQSDIQQQFKLSNNYMNKLNRDLEINITQDQQQKIDNILEKHNTTRVIGIDDVLALIGIIGAGYAAGHWAGAEAHKRFGLTPASYKQNRWWWRAGISAAAGIPAAIGFDDYFYGI